MEIIQSRTIQGESLKIDDLAFIGCTLIDCVLEYSGRPVSFHATHLRRCRYVFFGEARRTVQFLQNVGLMPFLDADWADIPTVVQ